VKIGEVTALSAGKRTTKEEEESGKRGIAAKVYK